MSDKTCKTCKYWQERYGLDAGICHRFPSASNHLVHDWCGEWEESKVTDEHTFLAGGVPAFKVTERENGTSTTEPVPGETHDEFDRSRWYELFGTPKRAARTLEKGKALCAWCDKQTCSTSGGECRIFDYDALLEWLSGDA